MAIERDMPNRQFINANAAVGGAWAAITLLFVMTVATFQTVEGKLKTRVPSVLWGAETLAVVALIAVLVTLMVREARDDRRHASPRTGRARVSGLALAVAVAVGAWLFGGLFNLVAFATFPAGHGFCGGLGGAGSFACLHRPTLVLEVLGVVSCLSATPALAILVWAGRRYELSAWLSPVVIFGLYLLALLMWMPHEGLGDPA